jgi:hypothetical protein
MKSNTIFTTFLIILALFILTACNLPGSSATQTDPGLVNTQTAQTAAAYPTQTVPTTFPTAIISTAIPSPTIATSTPPATATTVPTATSTASATPTTASTCTNQAKFVSDVTVPDDTEMLTGQEFVKTWRLENTGTCTWTDKYSLVFISGDQMNGISPLPLTGSTAPGGTADISVSLKAPGTTGTYRGDWQLRDDLGNNFGTGTNADQSFFLQIKVVEGVSELNLGEPTWRDNLDDVNGWFLLETENTKWSEGDGVLQMVSITPGGGEEWGLVNQPSLADFYLQATFITGDACTGLDRYGLLARAPEPNEGYVYEFSCDGHYRLYVWDGENYRALQDWRTAISIKTGPGQTNVMGLWMDGTTIRLYANGFKIGEFIDNTYDEGQFGLVIGSVNTEDFTVLVDRVEYWGFN